MKFLEKIRHLFSHPNQNNVILALSLLEMVVHSFGVSIRHGLAAKDHNIGVDVAAEQRFERCVRCRDALFQVRLNSTFLIDRLPENHRTIFNNLMIDIDKLGADLPSLV